MPDLNDLERARELRDLAAQWGGSSPRLAIALEDAADCINKLLDGVHHNAALANRTESAEGALREARALVRNLERAVGDRAADTIARLTQDLDRAENVGARRTAGARNALESARNRIAALEQDIASLRRAEQTYAWELRQAREDGLRKLDTAREQWAVEHRNERDRWLQERGFASARISAQRRAIDRFEKPLRQAHARLTMEAITRLRAVLEPQIRDELRDELRAEIEAEMARALRRPVSWSSS